MIFYESPSVKIEWNEEVSAVFITWKSFIYGEEYRTSLNKILDLMVQKKGQKFLFDSRKMRIINQDDQEWTLKNWVPRVVQAGLKYQAVILPMSQIAERSVETVVKKSEADSEDVTQYFGSLEAARDWLKTRQ